MDQHPEKALKIQWSDICKTQKLSEDFLNIFKKYLDWYNISYYQTLSEKFIEKNINRLNLSSVISEQKLSEEFIEKYWKYLVNKNYNNLENLLLNQNISLELFDKIVSDEFPILPKYYQIYIVKNQDKITEEFIQKYWNHINFQRLSERIHSLKEPFMRKFHEYLDWDKISEAQKLSEKFIEDFQNKVNWENIFKYQSSLSPEFKAKWKHKINK